MDVMPLTHSVVFMLKNCFNRSSLTNLFLLEHLRLEVMTPKTARHGGLPKSGLGCSHLRGFLRLDRSLRLYTERRHHLGLLIVVGSSMSASGAAVNKIRPAQTPL